MFSSVASPLRVAQCDRVDRGLGPADRLGYRRVDAIRGTGFDQRISKQESRNGFSDTPGSHRAPRAIVKRRAGPIPCPVQSGESGYARGSASKR